MFFQDDILLELFKYLRIYDILQLEIALNKTFDDTLWKYKAYYDFGKDFWIKAFERPAGTAYPLETWKKELVRIEKFQYLVEKTCGIQWTKYDFYRYWDSCDKLKKIFKT